MISKYFLYSQENKTKLQENEFYNKMRAKTIKQNFLFFKNVKNIKINKAYGGNKVKNNLTL
ncbi:hypothetical protein MM0357_11860 [Helicobacter pylori]